MNKTKIAFGMCIAIILVLGIFIAGCTTTSTPSSGTPPQTPAQNIIAPISATNAPTTPPTVTTVPAVQYKTYTNSPYGITLSYPENWEVQEQDSLALRDYGRSTINIANFYSPGNDKYASFSIDIDPTSETELESYYNHAVLALQAYYPNWGITKHNYQLKVSDNTAYRIDYQVTHDDSIRVDYGLQVYTLVKGTPYIFTYQAQDISPNDETYKENLDEAQAMIKSVTISPVTVTTKSR